MANASSTFLRGANANAIGSNVESPVPDESAVLAAVGKPAFTDTSGIANALGTTQQAVEPLIGSLLDKKLIDSIDGGGFELSPGGERAVRYLRMSKF